MASKRNRSDRKVTIARVFGMVCCIAGFVVIALGWNGMARVACVDCQLPYLLSGGAGGIGLLIFGVAILVIAEIRAERLRVSRQLAEMVIALTRNGRHAAGPLDGDVVPGTGVADADTAGAATETAAADATVITVDPAVAPPASEARAEVQPGEDGDDPSANAGVPRQFPKTPRGRERPSLGVHPD